jgi:Flp pilus assembly protein TadG
VEATAVVIRQFLRDRKAGIAPILALGLVPMVGLVGASVDYSRANAVRTSMQMALDSTALILSKEAQNSASSDLKQVATSYFGANFVHPDVTGLQISVTASPVSGGSSVAISANGTIKTTFMGVIGFTSLQIAARAGAVTTSDGLGCVLSLSRTASGAIAAGGTSAVSLNGCSLYDNSNNATALTAGGSARIEALSVGVVGGVSGGDSITTTQGIKTGLAPLADPYADVSVPSFSGCTDNKFTAKTTITIDPGVYCNGITVNAGAVLTLNPGIYYLDRGGLSVNGGGTMTGQGVTLVFTSSNGNNWSSASINGNAVVNLTPPIAGPTAGIVVFGDRNIPLDTSFKFNGGSTQYLGGAIYVPTGAISYSGGAGTSTSCTQIIGDTVTFTGNSDVAINCSSYKTRPFSAKVVKLVS